MILRRKNKERVRDDVVVANNKQNRRKNIDAKIVIAIIRAVMTAESKMSSQELNRL